MRIMRRNSDPVNIIYKISQLVKTLNDDDFKALENIVHQQEEYFNPLKPATVNEQRRLAEHNKKMINCLKDLKELVDKK